MADEPIIAHIDQLAREEHALFEKESHGTATSADQARLEEIGVLLDRCWDCGLSRCPSDPPLEV